MFTCVRNAHFGMFNVIYVVIFLKKLIYIDINYVIVLNGWVALLTHLLTYSLTHLLTHLLVGCPNAWIGCKEMQTYENHEKHARMRCAYRKAECRKGCGRYVPYCKRDDHETVLTPSLPPSLTHSLTHSLLLPGTLQVQTDCM